MAAVGESTSGPELLLKRKKRFVQNSESVLDGECEVNWIYRQSEPTCLLGSEGTVGKS